MQVNHDEQSSAGCCSINSVRSEYLSGRELVGMRGCKSIRSRKHVLHVSWKFPFFAGNRGQPVRASGATYLGQVTVAAHRCVELATDVRVRSAAALRQLPRLDCHPLRPPSNSSKESETFDMWNDYPGNTPGYPQNGGNPGCVILAWNICHLLTTSRVV